MLIVDSLIHQPTHTSLDGKRSLHHAALLLSTCLYLMPPQTKELRKPWILHPSQMASPGRPGRGVLDRATRRGRGALRAAIDSNRG